MLPQGHINFLPSFSRKAKVFCTGHNANNGHERSSCLRRRCIEEANTFSYWIPIGPMVSGNRFVNQCDQWRTLTVTLCEDSATTQPRANYSKIIRCNDTEISAH